MTKKLTLEDLARITQGGFEEAKRGLQDFRDEAEERFGGVDARFDSLHEEIREIKVVLPPLSRTVEALEAEVLDLRGRVKQLEKKVGLGR